MTSIEFIEKEIKETERSYKSFELDYRLFGRESDKRDADKLMKKLIHLRQVKKELVHYNILKTDYQISLAFQEAQKEEMQNLRKELDVEKWKGIAYWEDFKKLKKFALHFKKDIQEDYKRGENIIYDSLLDEFGEKFLNDLLNEVLNEN